MSRVLKFRAWDNTKKEWTLNIMECVSSPTGNIWMEPALKSHKVVIEQYTGLKDKNGKEIYEGDIVEFGLSGRAERGYVAYADEYASFEVYSKRDFIFGCLFGHAGKVIGNIHENPELLEDK